MKKNSFEILLINPPPVPNWDYQKKNLYAFPCGILSIGTVLKKNNFSVKLINGAYEEDYLKKCLEIVKFNNLLYVGISAMTSQVSTGLEIAKKIREVDPLVLLVWGGVHPTLFAEQAVRHALVDVAVIGEGEYTCLDLAILRRQRKDCKNLKGAICKIGNNFVKNQAREPLDLENLPFFDYSLINVEQYIQKDRREVGGWTLEGGSKRRSLPILSGLGCPYRCSFCIESITKKKYRRRSAESLIAEIEKLIVQYGINDVSFIDDLFFVDKNRLFRFLDLLEERKIDISWSTSVRANFFNKNYLNVDLLKRMRRLKCYHLGLGAESGSERILKKIDKQISKQDVIRAAKWCKDTDINIVFSFMIGLPGETEEEMRETIGFAFDLVNQNPLKSCIIGPNVFRPYPGSNLFKECVEKYNFRIPQSLEEWSKVFSVEEGYFKLENLPWIENPHLIRILCFYLFRGTTNFVYPKFWLRLGGFLLKKICRLRLKLNFFLFPLEYKIMSQLRRLVFNEK
jgi:radical SAM superfamily enzyme YgiQ (UPF0313 family)